MRILYAAKRGPVGNDDEGAIEYALTQLGHDVVRVPESMCKPEAQYAATRFDFLLCHHAHNFDALRAVKIPKVFWCFDLVQWPDDPTLESRNRQRRAWAYAMTDVCDLGFMTDGDWVADHPKKLRWLTQGFDERLERPPPHSEETVPILMVGSPKGGSARERFVSEMMAEYGDLFRCVERGVHGEALRTLLGTASIIVAPSAPVTNRYWSNRVYLMTGMRSFLLHPHTDGLRVEYNDHSLPMYTSMADLHVMIRWFLPRPGLRQYFASLSHRATLAHNTYRDRCRVLVETVQKELGV